MALPQAIEEQEKHADALMDQPEAEPTEAPPAPPAPPEKPKVDQTDYKERLSLFKESHDRTVSELRRNMAEMQQRLQDQEQERTRLESQVAELNELRRKSVPDDLFSDDERELIGEDLMPVLTRVTRTLAERETQPLAEQVQSLKRAMDEQRKRNQQRSQQADNRSFAERIVAAKEDAPTVDADPGFHEWLNSADPLSGMSNGELYKRAWNNRDVGRVVSLYEQWQKHTGGSQTDPREGRITPAPAAEQSRSTADGRIWTDDAVTQLYEQWRRGDISDKQAEALEADFFAAQRDGRYRPR